MRRYLPYIAILAAMIMWAASPIMTKVVLGVLSPLMLVTMRFMLAVLLMAFIGLICRRFPSMQGFALQRVERKDIPLFLLCGFVQPFLYYMFETYGLQLSASPTVSEVLLSTSPIFAPLFAWVLIREKVTLYNIAGILLSTGGVVMMVLAGNSGFEMGSPWGVLLLLLAVFSAVFYTIILRRIPSVYNSLSIVFWGQLVSLLLFFPVFCIVDLPGLLSKGLPQGDWGMALGAVGYLAVCSSVIAFILYCYTIRYIGVTRANAFNNIRPVFTALLMLIFFDEHLPLFKWIGMALVIVGLFICQYRGLRN